MGTVVLMLVSLVCAVLPMLTYLTVMWWLDRYEREPLWLVGLTFVWGAVGAVFLALIGNFIGHTSIGLLFGAETAELVAPVLVAPLVEEPTKALFLFLAVRSRAWDNMTDGFVYGAAAGLGFGMTENFLYFSTVASSGDLISWAGTIAIRTLYSALMHATATSCVGAALGWAKTRRTAALLLALPVGFGVAMGMHGLWNGLLTWDAAAQMNGQLTVLDFAVFPVEFITVFIVYQLCLRSESRLIQRELTEESASGLLPAAHVAMLASSTRRASGGWLKPRVPRALYVQAATRLAFRKAQLRAGRERSAASLEAEVQRLRAEITGLLALGEGPRPT